MTTDTPLSDLPDAAPLTSAAPVSVQIEAPEPEKTAPRMFVDNARAAILARYSEAQKAAGDESLQAIRAATEAALHEDERGGSLPGATVAAPAAPVISDELPACVTVKVYGREFEVPQSAVDAAGGVEAFQKNAAADERMRRAAEIENTLAARDASLREREARLTAPQATAAAAPPTGERAAVTSRQDVQKLLEAVLESDADTYATQLQTTVARIVESEMGKRVPAAAAPAPAPVAAAIAPPVRSVEEITRANAVFDQEYRALSNAPEAFAIARELMAQRMADPANAGIPLDLLARDVGARVSKTITPAARANAMVQETLAQRRTVKARLPSVSSAAGVPAPSPGNQPTPSQAQRATDYIQQRRMRSGSNSTMVERAAR